MEPRSIVVAAMLILASARAAVGATRHDGEGTTSMGAFFENAYLPALPVILSR
jgi:hypothetical protein